MRKIAEKRLKLPGLFWDGESWVKAEKYPAFTIFTDRVLSEILQVSPMTVSMWRKEDKIPFKILGSSFAIYDLNLVLHALQEAGYQQDPKLKSEKS